MNRLKVMIVDDEILAIEHLKRLIDWEREGFCVAGESARPLQALTRVAELQPDLIIADIRMPHLDGLEFTKRVFAAGHRCRVILLTSYKEFDYAKEAISIGVTEYLVKHELEAESLRRELAKVRIAIDEERRRSSMMLKQYLKELIDGNTPADELAAAAAEKLKGRHFTYVLLAAEESFPVLPVKGSEANGPVWDGSLPQLTWHDIEVAWKKDGRIGLLLAAKPIASKREAAVKHAEAALELRTHMQSSCSEQRIMAVYSELFERLDDLCAVHRNMIEQLAAALYYDTLQLAGPVQPVGLKAADTQGQEDGVPEREAFVGHLKAGSMSAAVSLIESCFDTAARRRSIPYLSKLCGALTSALDSIRAERGLPTLTQLANEGMVRTDQWRSLAGIQAWLISKVEETLSTAAMPQVSRKIRDTTEYIAAHCSEELSAESIALHLGISGEHLRHLFKQETGKTLLDYITMYRMERAKSLLESGHFKVYEVSGKVGYKSSHYFSKVFSKLVGMPPLEYAEAKGAAR